MYVAVGVTSFFTHFIQVKYCSSFLYFRKMTSKLRDQFMLIYFLAGAF